MCVGAVCGAGAQAVFLTIAPSFPDFPLLHANTSYGTNSSSSINFITTPVQWWVGAAWSRVMGHGSWVTRHGWVIIIIAHMDGSQHGSCVGAMRQA